jgi:predicted phage-related endonuclease
MEKQDSNRYSKTTKQTIELSNQKLESNAHTLNRARQISVSEDNVRRLAAQLQSDFLQITLGCVYNQLTDFRRTYTSEHRKRKHRSK